MIPHQPPWMDVAWEWLGIQEWTAPGESNPEVEAMHKAVDGQEIPDDISWCSSTLCALFQKVGIESTHSRAAKSWLNWGVAISHPVYGCVCVLWRESPDSWKGHVGLFLGFIDDDVLMWGGNQHNEISVRRYPASRVLGYRLP